MPANTVAPLSRDWARWPSDCDPRFRSLWSRIRFWVIPQPALLSTPGRTLNGLVAPASTGSPIMVLGSWGACYKSPAANTDYLTYSHGTIQSAAGVHSHGVVFSASTGGCLYNYSEAGSHDDVTFVYSGAISDYCWRRVCGATTETWRLAAGIGSASDFPKLHASVYVTASASIGATQKGWCDGRALTSQVTTAAATTPYSTKHEIGHTLIVAATGLGYCGLNVMWDRALTDAEALLWSREPFGMFRRTRRMVQIPDVNVPALYDTSMQNSYYNTLLRM